MKLTYQLRGKHIIIILLALLGTLSFNQNFRSIFICYRSIILTVLFSLAGIAALVFFTIDYFSIDTCLDAGGRWIRELKICLYEKPIN
ncbi:hypothetical protein LX59_00563 [Azomonas agilis]|uniref:Uncharacterized protein n=1 Tax=Azomonas agilis TaxID=116849 RepID=A0A562J153_9GAMM|nr:hypothetical protein LX59_00563 [Azomonas agilis]